MRIRTRQGSWHLGVALLLAALVAVACGKTDEAPPAAAPATVPEPPGTYVLDVKDWQQRAEKMAGSAHPMVLAMGFSAMRIGYLARSLDSLSPLARAVTT